MDVRKENYERNIVLAYMYFGFGVRLIAPIVVFYLLNKGLTLTQVMVLQSINAFSIFLLEVPTGAVADMIGRKSSLTLSSIMLILGLIIYVGSGNYYVFIVAEIMFGFGLCFKSGADSALIYESLKEIGRADEYAKIQGKAQSYSFLMQVIGSAVVGYLYSLNVNLPYLLSIGLLAISIVPTILMTEPNRDDKKEKPGYMSHVKDSARFVVNHRQVRALIIYSAFIYTIWRIGFWYYQPYLKAIDVNIKYVGMLFAGFNLLAAISARRANDLIDVIKDKSLVFLSLLFLISLLSMGMISTFVGALLFSLQEIARGLRRPILLKYINERIPNDKRATIISFKSLIENCCIILVYPIVGILMDNFDIIALHIHTGIAVTIGVFIFYRYLKVSTVTTS